MRSGGNVSTLTNNAPKNEMSSSDNPPVATNSSLLDEKTVQTSKCKGATTIPIFLKSELIDALKCDTATAQDTCCQTRLFFHYDELISISSFSFLLCDEMNGTDHCFFLAGFTNAFFLFWIASSLLQRPTR